MKLLQKALNTARVNVERFVFWMVVITAVSPCYAESSQASLQAAFIYNFIKFIDWPAENTPENIRLCVTGANQEMRESLDLLNGKIANKQAIALVYINLENLGTIHTCHMLYRPNQTSAMVLPHPLPKGVVLVANNVTDIDVKNAVNEQSAADASITLLRNAEGRIEFSINTAAVARAGVKISSQLLKLAKTTQGDKG